jgi:hypothetical protein
MKKSGTRRLLSPPYRTPIFTALGLLIAYLILMLISGGMTAANGQAGRDLLVCIVGMACWLLFFAQFTLPLKRLKQREEVFYRLLSYVIGTSGPAIRIENGKILERKGEMDKMGAGVVILDTASAALVRNPAQFITAIGPGVYFTNPYESIAGTVDLHLQRKSFGPDKSKAPFAPQAAEESEPAYKARQARRFLTQGLTRDGIEVVPRIGLAVKIDAPMNQGNTYFGYDDTAVDRAIRGLPVDLGAAPGKGENSQEQADLPWLPLRLAADIWKECISSYTLEELFSFNPGDPTALQAIADEMKQRLTSERYNERDAFGRRVSSERVSREYEMLKRRGVRVIAVTVSFIKVRKEIEDRLIGLWTSTWLTRAQREYNYVQQQRSYEADKGKHTALLIFARRVSHFLGGQDPALRLTGEQILRQLIRGTLQLTRQESELHRVAADEIDQLKELQEWSEERPEL